MISCQCQLTWISGKRLVYLAGIVRWLTWGLNFVSFLNDRARDSTRSRKYGNCPKETNFLILDSNLQFSSHNSSALPTDPWGLLYMHQANVNYEHLSVIQYMQPIFAKGRYSHPSAEKSRELWLFSGPITGHILNVSLFRETSTWFVVWRSASTRNRFMPMWR